VFPNKVTSSPTLREHTDVHPRVRVELTGHLSPGGNTTAKIRVWQNGAFQSSDRLPITVHDTEGMYTGDPGMYGRAEWMADTQQWELYQLQCT
jgi:hypothetical protein